MGRGRRRKRSTWGSVEEMSPGVWRIRYRADTGDGRGYVRRCETLHCSRVEADNRYAELRSMYGGEAGRRRVPTFDELWSRDVLPQLEEDVARNTMRAYMSAWSHVSGRWGDVRLDAYNGADVQDWLKTLPMRTGKTCLTLMRKVSNRALLLGVVRYDPLAADIKVSRWSTREPERTELDLGPYLAAAADGGPMMLAGVILMAAGGCRFGEALAVRADSVQWDEVNGRSVFEVADQVDVYKTELAGRLKNEQSRRTASVPGYLGRRLHEVALRALSEGCVFVVDDGLGRPIGENAFRQRWKRLLDARGLPRVTMRSLRRSFATMALNAGADAGDVNLSMGHTRDSRVLFASYDRPGSKNAPVIPDAWENLGMFGEI